MAKVVIENLLKVFQDKHGPPVAAVNRINLTIEDRDIAMAFQNYALYPHMSVFENMAFGLKLRHMPKAEIAARVGEAAAMLGLEPYLDRRPKALSGGQRQRVAVGRAIVRKPKVFLFDEPLSNLDAKMRVSTRAEISKLHARLGATMICVTHDQAEAMTMGDRICVMKDGRIMQVAEPLALYDHPDNLFVAGFIGSPPMNLIKGTIERTGPGLIFVESGNPGAPMRIRLDDVQARKAAAFVGRPLIFGIRSEDVRNVATSTEADPDQTADLAIEVVEPMGAETFLYLDSGANSIIARVKAGGRSDAGRRLKVVFDAAKGHLFDPATEDVLH